MAFCRAITKRLIDGYRQVSKTKIIMCHYYMTSSKLKDRIGVGIESVAPPPGQGVKGLTVTVSETKKLLKVYQMEKLKARLREIPQSSVSYLEFVQICRESCGNNDEQGFQVAKSLDHSGCVVVLGDIVFLHPHQIAKTMEAMINQTSAIPNDPRKEELVQLEVTKKYIDMKARRIVKAELYCGLVFLVAQTLGFMRLTFWELSWDVMEPICFFLTSLYFLSGYCFFLRTSTEPSFEGFYQQRFKAKQKKLMDSHGFDFLRYSQLKSLFTPVTL